MTDAPAKPAPRPKRRKSSGSRPGRKRPPRRRRGPLLTALAGVGVLLAVLAGFLGHWLGAPRRGEGRAVSIVWPEDGSIGHGVQRLVNAGAVDGPVSMHFVLLVASPLFHPEPGLHLLSDDLTPAEVIRRLVRLSSRAHEKLVIPEGLNRFQIGERLEALRVCSTTSFRLAGDDGALLAELGLSGADSPEGYLFPATYDLLADTDARSVVRVLAGEGKKRIAKLRDQNEAKVEELQTKYGFRERDWVTFASVVQKEAARDDEMPLIASVFWNRLSSSEFKPARSLQSDPTAAYGCIVNPALESCRGYAGRVLPAMLRDTENPYNTYRHPGLPPGPIANPGVAALSAVLNPATTDYLFFVASGGGRHTFSRTLEEHETAVHKPH
ncbi:MAG TPA: endolytic transglycosylase MltG [Polyangiaceae bacterium]|nr:endolytic transglycosylase MltG [Polyangiaceae bacterium]